MKPRKEAGQRDGPSEWRDQQLERPPRGADAEVEAEAEAAPAFDELPRRQHTEERTTYPVVCSRRPPSPHGTEGTAVIVSTAPATAPATATTAVPMEPQAKATANSHPTTPLEEETNKTNDLGSSPAGPGAVGSTRTEDGEFLESFRRLNIKPSRDRTSWRTTSSGGDEEEDDDDSSGSSRSDSAAEDGCAGWRGRGPAASAKASAGLRTRRDVAAVAVTTAGGADDDDDDGDHDSEDERDTDPELEERIMQLCISCSARPVEYVARAPVYGQSNLKAARSPPYAYVPASQPGVLAAAANHFRGGDVAAATVSASIAVEVGSPLRVFSARETDDIIEDWIREYDDSPLESPVSGSAEVHGARSFSTAIACSPGLASEDRASSEGYVSGSDTSGMSPGTPGTPYQHNPQSDSPPHYIRQDGIKWPKDRARQEPPAYRSPDTVDIGVTSSALSSDSSRSPSSASWCSTGSLPSANGSPSPASPPRASPPQQPSRSLPPPEPEAEAERERCPADGGATMEDAPNHRWMRSQFKGRPRPYGYGLGANKEPELINLLRAAEDARPAFQRIYEAARCYLEGHIALLYEKDSKDKTALYYAARIQGYDGIAGFVAECLLEAQTKCSRIKGGRQYKLGEERYPPYGDNIFHCLARWHHPHSKNLVMTAATLLKFQELQPLLIEANDQGLLPAQLNTSGSDMVHILHPTRLSGLSVPLPMLPALQPALQGLQAGVVGGLPPLALGALGRYPAELSGLDAGLPGHPDHPGHPGHIPLHSAYQPLGPPPTPYQRPPY